MFIKDPTDVFHAYMRSLNRPSVNRESFDCGRLCMALEIITQIKLFEETPILSDAVREECVSALHTILTDTGIEDEAYRWYEMLGEWRKPTFVTEPDALQPRTASVAVRPSQGQLDAGETSPASIRLSAPLPPNMPCEPLGEHRRIDPVSREVLADGDDAASGEDEQSRP